MKFPRVPSTILRLTIVIEIAIVVRAQQRFKEVPAIYQEVSAGHDVQLPCKVQDKKGQCIWQKDRKPVGIYPDKYEWFSLRSNDCTLLIRRASLEFDDGFWECQVTSGDFMRQDALTSLPARLLVRVKPRKPSLEYGGTILNTSLTLREGQEVTISCVSRYGNPVALIKWFIGDEEVEPLREQMNATEVDNPKTWAAHSLLRIRGRREYHGRMIRCITIHPSSPVPATAESQLNIHYSPEVRFQTSPRWLTSSLEDSASFMNLKCIADANPSAMIKWFKDSTPISDDNILLLTENRTNSNNTSTISELRFEPVKRDDAGLYSCKAVNIIGESPQANYALDVQFAPRAKRMENSNDNETLMEIEETTQLGSNVETFECPEFEGNPIPRYKWIHLRGGTTEKTIENPTRAKDSGKRLRLENVMWSDEGEYRCIAFNMISGTKRETPSDVRYMLHVTGPPEIQARPSSSGKNGTYESIGWAGEPVHRLKSRFCSRPPPRLVAWQWGSSHIRAGESIQPKYEALPLEPIIEDKIVTNCYWAKLEIKNLHKEDSRMYTLLVESEKGRDSTNIKLIIRDPSEMKVIAAASAIGLLLLLLLISIGIYSMLRIKQRRYRCEEDEGSIAADALYGNNASMDRQKTTKNLSVNKGSPSKSTQDGNLAVLYDYDQIAKQARTMSPEALKVRRAPAVLQPPTMV
ncbi:PREDICTED: hemicentin-2-like [Polistes canadensis]|uniref:hemicentin-2-like n=1 Tax=Polistes canadensis TaxID=91411 RepID=UPI000718C0CC|nr:PREDICTED: hemicentin-2-like [Polistes canadensis]